MIRGATPSPMNSSIERECPGSDAQASVQPGRSRRPGQRAGLTGVRSAHLRLPRGHWQQCRGCLAERREGRHRRAGRLRLGHLRAERPGDPAQPGHHPGRRAPPRVRQECALQMESQFKSCQAVAQVQNG